MAYVQGLRPVRTDDGSAWNGATVRCAIESDYATALFVGDPVIMVDAGGVNLQDTSTAPKNSDVDGGTYPIIEIATAGAAAVIWGVIVGFEPDRSDLSLVYSKASTASTARVARATPDLIFEAGVSAAVTIAHINEATDLIAGAGDTATGYSGWRIDQGGYGTGSQVYITGLSNRVGNYTNLATTNAIWEVKIQSIQMTINPVGLGLSA